MEVPIQVRRRISVGQRELIKMASVQYEVNTVTGEYTPKAVDQEKMTTMSLMTMIVSWPFQYKDGKPVPVNESTVRSLGSINADAIMTEFAKLEQKKADARDPFVAPSEAA